MAAGGFKEFVAGEVLDEDEINDYLMQGVLVFAGTAARGSAITAPVEGQFAFLKDSDQLTYHDGSDWVQFTGGGVEFQYLVVAGGGGGGVGVTTLNNGGGGGAGGYRCNVPGENTGGGISAEPLLRFPNGTVTVTVGAGGAQDTNGSNSVFSSILSIGGGRGGSTVFGGQNGGSGGGGASGGGSGVTTSGAGVIAQGFAGAVGLDSPNFFAGGGGGASEAGNTDGGSEGGDGVASSITGSSVTRGGGGGGGSNAGLVSGGTGGGGAGADASITKNGGAGTVNTGGGGGGGAGGSTGPNGTGGAGGSGVVILKYPDSITLTIGVGLTSSTSTAGGFKTTTFTAGTDTVSF